MEQEAGAAAVMGEGQPQASPVTPPAPKKQPELLPTPEPQPIGPGEIPAEPALRPAAEPQASSGTPTAPAREGTWNAPAGNGTRTVPATNADWTPAAKGGNDGSGANPPPLADDRSAAGWNGVQR